MKKLTALLFSLVLLFGTFALAEGTQAVSPYYKTVWSMLPALIAIILALITKEVYSSLFVGIVAGGLMYSNFSFTGTITHVLSDGIVASVADTYNMGILVFLVVLGTMVVLMNRAGGSAAFGRWASQHIKTRAGAQLATIALGVLIFIDDYFNCLTVGSVMLPVTDRHRISRAKLAYLIDSTAAPICIIAPVSSWAAAVSGFVGEGNGLAVFIKAIPYNFYALLTIGMMLFLAVTNLDFGPMRKHEKNAMDSDDLFSGMKHGAEQLSAGDNPNSRVRDLVVPILLLIVCCIIGMLYSGGFFEGANFVDAFSGADASIGLMFGSVVALILTIIFYSFRHLIGFKSMMESIPDGFKSMVPAILILTFAWTLKAMTDSLGAREFVAGLVKDSAGSFRNFLPAIIFLIGCALAFATGTSWGTFGILIPITLGVFPLSDPMGIICVSACMAGAVCGDHCSPISDTTIMASAGAQCDHVTHVSTQLPYAMTCAGVSCVSYIIAGFIHSWLICLPIAFALLFICLMVLRKITGKKTFKVSVSH